VLRESIVRVLFEHGRFDAEDTRRMAGAVLCYALGLVAYAATKIQIPTFYALGDTRTPVLGSMTAVTAKIGANFLLIFLFRRIGIDPFLGLALSTSLAAWINFVWLGVGLRRRVGRLDRYRVVSTFVKMFLVSVVMGAISALTHAGLERWAGGGGLAGEIARLAAAIAGGVACVALGIHALDLPEGRALLAILRRR
jgi:putative peptidoglycan lipid II flippase